MNDAWPQPVDAPEAQSQAWLAMAHERAPVGHWDELRGSVTPLPSDQAPPTDRPLSAPWQRFIDPLLKTSTASQGALNSRMADLQRQVRDNGVSYNAYTTADQPQRPWSLDLFPLMLGHTEWQQIESGVMQRMQLLERIMADAYGPQELVLRGQLPAALVQGHPAYLPAMHGVTPVGKRYLSLAAFDLARGPDGRWWLLSQRTQAPSGLGYLLENRHIVSRLFPQAFEALPVQGLASTYRTLIDGIRARSPAGASAHIALLTPGPYNETYFEHAYLARHLGLSLAQGNDLTVRDQKLYLKTLQGLQPVHGLLKRVDDDWLDPLELRADSMLGVPGLLQAVRSGHVLMANTPGSGFLESNALLGFMPALARDLLGQTLQLPAIPSWWCGESAARQDVLPRIQSCVIKPTYPQHRDRHSFEPVWGQALSQRELDDWTGRILRDPEAYTLQSWLPLSHQPTWQTRCDGASGIQTRPVVLRVFAVVDAQGGWQVLPGGLARLGTREGIASMQRGGSSADVWVQSSPTTPSPSDQSSCATPTASSTPAINTLPRLITSRAAENLFWMGRYTERTDNTLGLVRLSLDILGRQGPQAPCLLSFINCMASRYGLVRPGVPGAEQAPRVFERSLIAGLWDQELATSVGFHLRAVRLAAASVRERFSPEQWRLLEQAQAHFLQTDNRPTPAPYPTEILPDSGSVQPLLADTRQKLAALTDAQTDPMQRDDGWHLLWMGRHIERLVFLSQALGEAVQRGLFQEQAGMDAVLDLFDSTPRLPAPSRQSLSPQALMAWLVTDPDHPHALGGVAHTLRSRLQHMGHLAQGATLALAAHVPALTERKPELLWPLHATQSDLLQATLADCQDAARDISDQLCKLFFSHSGEDRYSVGA